MEKFKKTAKKITALILGIGFLVGCNNNKNSEIASNTNTAPTNSEYSSLVDVSESLNNISKDFKIHLNNSLVDGNQEKSMLEAISIVNQLKELYAVNPISNEQLLKISDLTNRLKLLTQKSASEKSASEKSASEKLASEKLASEKLASEKAASEKAASEKAASGKAASEETNRNIRLIGEKLLKLDQSHHGCKPPSESELKKIPELHKELNRLILSQYDNLSNNLDSTQKWFKGYQDVLQKARESHLKDVQKIIETNKLQICKGESTYWDNCWAQIFEDGKILREGVVIKGKREGKWVEYPPFTNTGLLPEIRDYLNGYRVDGDCAESSLKQMEKDKENKDRFEKIKKKNEQFSKYMDCLSAGGSSQECKDRYSDKFKE